MRTLKNRTSFLTSEFRAEQTEDKLFIEGYFIKFNSETELYAGVFEEVSASSVTKSLKEKDIRCLFNHDTGKVLGRTGNGTLELKADEVGLYGKVEVNQNDPEAMSIYAKIQRGDISACSFGFYPKDEAVEMREDGTTKFTIKDMDLFEVSCVTFPAYPQTEVSARNSDIQSIKEQKLKQRKAKLKERFKNG